LAAYEQAKKNFNVAFETEATKRVAMETKLLAKTKVEK